MEAKVMVATSHERNYFATGSIDLNPLMNNDEKWPNILLKFCCDHTVKFLKNV